MKLLRCFSLALIAFSAMVGCIDNPDGYDPDYVISFVPAVKAMDGDLSEESSEYPQGQTFGVWAFMLPEGQTWDSNSSKATSWLNNAAVSLSGNAWKTADSKHWGKTGEQLTFFAYSPASLPMQYDSSKGLLLSGYNTLEDDMDILYCDAVKDVEKNAVTGCVGIPFKHALSKVEFRARAAENDVEIVLKSVTVGGIFYKGDFHSQPAGWELTTDKTDIEFCTAEAALSNEPVSLANINVLAQSQPRPVTVVFDAFFQGKQVIADKTFTIKPITGKWGVGRQYVYTLDVMTTGVTYKTDIID